MAPRHRTDRLLLSDIELDVMKWVWEKTNVSAASVQIQMVRSGMETAYNTVKTTLDRLVKAGVCCVKEVKGQHYFAPLLSRDEIARHWIEYLRKMIFGKA